MVCQKIREQASAQQAQLIEEYETAKKQYTEHVAQQAATGSQPAGKPVRPGCPLVKLEATSGPYEGTTFTVAPKKKEHARNKVKIGRSKQKLFVRHGISLPKDEEVSTTHAHIKMDGDDVVFVDVGSSNGSWVDGEEACEGDAHKLVTGTVLTMGASDFKVTVEPV
eukprot:g3238.t1